MVSGNGWTKGQVSVIVTTLCVVATICGLAWGDCFRSFYAPVAYPIAYSTAYVAPVNFAKVQYELGQPQQIAAKQQYVMRTDPDYDRFLQFKAFEAGFAASQQQVAQQVQRGQPIAGGSAPIPPQQNEPLFRTHCKNCHGIELDAPKGQFYLDASVGLSGDQIINAVKRMDLPSDHPDVMPPAPVQLPGEVKGGIFRELLSLQVSQSQQRTPQNVIPPPVPNGPNAANGSAPSTGG